jgi:hypothetical protein
MGQQYDPPAMAHVRWKGEPDEHDYPAATDFLELVLAPALAERTTTALRAATTVQKKAKDVLRAARLDPLDAANVHVAKDLKKVHDDEPLSPVLLVRGDGRAGAPLLIADGYHRVCAVHLLDEDAAIPCRLVDLPS